MNVAILIVNFKTPNLVLDLLESLADEFSRWPCFRVWIGDSDSGDGSVQVISEFIDARNYTWANCDAIGRNGGFAFANSVLYERYVRDDPDVSYVHFLNPDTIVCPGAVEALAKFLSVTPGAGAAGSRLENPDGSPRPCMFYFPSLSREFLRGASMDILYRLARQPNESIRTSDKAIRVDWVSGASFMVPRQLLERIGLMDPGYFLYFEETDLMARITSAGCEVWHIPQSRVVHLAGQATGYRSDAPPMRLSPHWLQSRSRYFRRHHGRLGLALATLLFLSGDIVHRVRCIVLFRNPNRQPALWNDYLRNGWTASERNEAHD